MFDLTQRVLKFIRDEHLIEPHESVLIGASGGIDSTALLYVLHTLSDTIPFSLAVAHVNHMLRGGESERDEAFVEDVAGALSLPFHVKRVDVKELTKNSGKSVQHAGRDARYDFFRELTEAYRYDRIAIAHNRDDQVETFVLRVIKGTGLRGLSCIPVKRGRIIRPFLETTRQEIEGFVHEKGIGYVEDSSNIKDAYERNYVRHRILPSMERLNPRVHSRIMSLLGDLTRLNERLERQAEAFLQAHLSKGDDGFALPVDHLTACDEETRFRALSLVLGELSPGFIALREHMGLIEKVLASSRPNSLAALPSGIAVRKEYGRIICTTDPIPAKVPDIFTLQFGHNRIEPLGLSLDVSQSDRIPSEFPDERYLAFLDAAKACDLMVRTFRDGDRFTPLGMTKAVKLKDYFISRKIPRWARRNIPLLITGDTIAWVVGERIDDRFKVTYQTAKVLVVRARKLSARSGEPVEI